MIEGTEHYVERRKEDLGLVRSVVTIYMLRLFTWRRLMIKYVEKEGQ